MSEGEGEFIALTGNVEALGGWNHKNASVLSSVQGKWTGCFHLPQVSTVQYRYFIGAYNQYKELQVITWESHVLENGRSFTTPDVDHLALSEDVFGIVNKQKLENGWLTRNTEVRISISSLEKLPFLTILKDSKSTTLTSLSVKPVVCPKPFSMKMKVIQPCSHTEITDVPEHGIKVPGNEETHICCVVETSSLDCTQIAIEVYNSDERGASFLGRAIVCGHLLPHSKGILRSPLLDRNDVVIGSIRLSYLIIKPTPDLNLTMKTCFIRHWERKPTVFVGHRGCGNSFSSQRLADIRENSIASFCKAAECGAYCVEFDVHLSKDKVPIVYHDLTTCLAVAENSTPNKTLLYEVPVCKLTLEELRSFSTEHRSRKKSSRPLEFPVDAKDEKDRAFPTLREVFQQVPLSTGFNIEVKWPTLDINNKYEDGLGPGDYFDANEFVDAILKVVCDCARDRRVIFSSFDVDICIMLRRKQNKYPVLFLTNGDTLHYTPMLDLRERTNQMAIGTILSEGFLGLDTLENDVYATPEVVKKVHDLGLLFACYGDDVGENLARMRDLSVDVAIFDRIHKVLPPHDSEKSAES